MKTKHVRGVVISSNLTSTKTQGDALYIMLKLPDKRQEAFVARGRIARLIDNWIRVNQTVDIEVELNTSIVVGVTT